MNKAKIVAAVLILSAVSAYVFRFPLFGWYLHRSEVAAWLKDPSSASFRNVAQYRTGTFCGEVNGKNSFGAFTGYKRYVANVEMGRAVIDPFPAITEDEKELGAAFNELWATACAAPRDYYVEANVENERKLNEMRAKKPLDDTLKKLQAEIASFDSNPPIMLSIMNRQDVFDRMRAVVVGDAETGRRAIKWLTIKNSDKSEIAFAGTFNQFMPILEEIVRLREADEKRSAALK